MIAKMPSLDSAIPGQVFIESVVFEPFHSGFECLEG